MTGSDSPGFDEEPGDLFRTGEIFANRELVQVSHVPELDRVVGRSEEIKEVGYALGPATEGGPPETTIIYGKTGTGKSLVSRCVTREAARNAKQNDVNLQHVYVDCSDYQSETQASIKMAQGIHESLGVSDSTVSIPSTGLSAAAYRDRLWEMLNEFDVDSFVVILDEVDKLNSDDGDDLLRSLSRARESGKTDTQIGLICISNKIDYRGELEERVESSLQDKELVFDPYGPGQIEDILESRRDAFYDGVLADGVIPKTAALAAREHGDARKAVDTLYEAGRLAEKQNAEQVTVDHVEEAVQEAEINRFQKLISGQPPHAKYILRALALLTKNYDRERFRTSQVYDFYKRVADQEGSSPLSYDRMHQLLKEQAFLGVTEREHTGGGLKEGSYHHHRLLREPDVVIEAIEAETV